MLIVHGTVLYYRRVDVKHRCAMSGAVLRRDSAVVNANTPFSSASEYGLCGQLEVESQQGGGILEMMYMSRQQLEARFQPSRKYARNPLGWN